jgi:hypothetical protein
MFNFPPMHELNVLRMRSCIRHADIPAAFAGLRFTVCLNTLHSATYGIRSLMYALTGSRSHGGAGS